MTRLAFRTIVLVLAVTSLTGCGALQLSLPEGSTYALPPGPPLPPGGNVYPSYALPTNSTSPPNFFFPGLFGGGTGSNPTGGDSSAPPNIPTTPTNPGGTDPSTDGNN